ncbi:DUF3048 domain-containing protein [Streptomyces piniterrae]|uniref:DUF3048 domain-containing protein n=1 Tax=Streptomyces piniterrae TaxID=2571125 RepID=A0A4U0MUG5_9ACTN|nr:DUF3048 domain-containing protein [Streptomyces piniterrae]
MVHLRFSWRGAVAGLAAAALALGLAGCANTGPDGDAGPKSRTVSPFTGLPASSGRPVLAVKIDNVGPARPPTGLGAADICYVEQVEGGQTRILAVLSSRLPPKLGPVRSARESDLELLGQFGRPALAYSGAQTKLLPLIAVAPLYDLPPGKAPDAYFRDRARSAPHNLYLRPERLLGHAPEASEAADIGFRFGAAPPGGREETAYTVRYPASRFDFTWSHSDKKWLVAMDGAAARTTDGGRTAASTVVVQQVNVRDSGFQDRWGSVSPFTETVGSGSAVVLRDGKAYDARWSRAAEQVGTTFTTPAGEPLNFARGQIWVMLTGR